MDTRPTPVWTGLRKGASSVPDLGCGIGRVARPSPEGLPVTGVDLDPLLVDDLERLRPGPGSMHWG